jgi:hypothetical protein
MRRLLTILSLLTLPACAAMQTTSPTSIPGVGDGIMFAGGNGLSCSTRVVILGASGSRAGVSAEHAWLHAKYPGYRLKTQALGECEGHDTDVLTLTTSEGKDTIVYFDISDFFGKELDR